jgi:hypothetical protein
LEDAEDFSELAEVVQTSTTHIRTTVLVAMYAAKHDFALDSAASKIATS